MSPPSLVVFDTLPKETKYEIFLFLYFIKGQKKITNPSWLAKEGMRKRAVERVGNFLKKRKETFEKLIKRGIFKQNRIFGSTIPAIAKVNQLIMYVLIFMFLNHISSLTAQISLFS